jgi:WD40 repeat protein
MSAPSGATHRAWRDPLLRGWLRKMFPPKLHIIRTLEPGSSGEQAFVSWSPDGRRIACGSNCEEDDTVIQIYDAAAYVPQSTINGVITLTWSPDSKFLACISRRRAGRRVEVRDADTGALVHQLPIQGPDICTVSWNPADAALLAVCLENAIQVWSVTLSTLKSSSLVRTFTETCARSVSWSPDGTKLVAPSFITRIWDSRTWALVHAVYGPPISWSPDSTRLVSGREAIVLVDAATGKYVRTAELCPRTEFEFGKSAHVKAVYWSPDPSVPFIVAIGAGVFVFNAVYVLNAVTLDEVCCFSRPGGSFQACWSPDATRVALTSTNGQLDVLKFLSL